MIMLDRAKLKAAARFAADTKDARLSLHGVLIEASPAGVRLVATDGRVMLVQRAAEDLGSNLGLFGLRQGGDGSGLVYISDDAVGVIMPMRSSALDVDFCQWAAE